jgi:arachidonate 15-lipoxygenase
VKAVRRLRAPAGDYRPAGADDRPDRPAQLAAMRAAYRYEMWHGIPVTPALTPDDMPERDWRQRMLLQQVRLRRNVNRLVRRGRWTFANQLPELSTVELLQTLHGRDFVEIMDYFVPELGPVLPDGRAKTLDDFRTVFASLPLPGNHDTFESDESFARGFVAGPDPTRLTRLSAVPAKFPIAQEHLVTVPALASDDLVHALAEGRVFWVDYQAMAGLGNGIHPRGPKFIYAPMIAFCVGRDGGLHPFAIQCGQEPAGREIYTPADGYSWKIAKNCVLVAHNTFHEVVTHLGLTHLLTEAVMVATVRNLAATHPVSGLLRTHFEGTALINHLALSVLVQPGRAVDQLIGADLGGAYELLGRERLGQSFRGNYLPNRLDRASTGDPRTLPDYPYRDDGLPLWAAIAEWAGDLVGAYYGSDADVRADPELQAWAAEIAAPDGGKVRDFGSTPGQIADRVDLAEILTMIIWTAGPQHAAVNFPQLPDMSFLPANPLAGFAAEPTGRDHTEGDWLATFPPIDAALTQLNISTMLGAMRYTTLGEYRGDFTGTAAAPALATFQRRLRTLDRTLTDRNSGRVDYPYLLPSRVPQSTNI